MRIVEIYRKVVDSSTFKTLAVFASVNMLVSLIQGVAGLVQARWVSPEVLGEFRKYGILTSYAALSLILVQDGFMRQFPYLIGKGDREGAIRIAGVAKCWYILVLFFMALVFIALTVRSLIFGDYVATVGWGSQIVIFAMMSYGTFLAIIYRRSMEFKRLSYNGFIASIAGVIALVFIKPLGYFGVALRVCIVDIVSLFCNWKYLPMKIKAVWDRRDFIGLVKISIPLSLIGYLRTSFLTASFSYLVLKYCGEKDLGLYGIAVVFQQFALLFTNSLTQIFNVKSATHFGATDSIKKSFKPLLLPAVLGGGAALLLACALCITATPFISYFLPKYKGAIPIIYILSLAMPVLVLGMPTGLLKTALKYKLIYIVGVAKVLSVIVAVFLLPKTIVWISVAVVIGELVDVVLGYFFLLNCIRQEGPLHEN